MSVTEIRAYDGRLVRTIETCDHERVTAVESVVTGEPLAALCLDCDEQLGKHWLS